MAGFIILAICAVAFALYMAWSRWRLKREVYRFADALEANLDHLIAGEVLEDTGNTEDSLWGKVNEKLVRAAHIEEQKRQESIEGKKRIQELISDISHQTKTPIANQKVYLELLHQEPQSGQGRAFLRQLELQTDKLDFLFQSMVKVSRLENGIIHIKKQKTDMVKTLGEAIASVVPAASKKNIELSVECEEPLFLPHDKKWTEEAVFNILDNAVKYTEADGKVKIQVIRQEIFTKICIRDSGKGIAPERQAQIFTRFYREPEVHDREGIGIGLYLARTIIEVQNGYIEVQSEPGQGSEFSVYLPND